MAAQHYLEKNEEYLGHEIKIRGGTDIPFLIAVVQIRQGEDEVCRFWEHLDHVLQSQGGWPENEPEAILKLMDQGFHRARGAILLNRLEELNGAKLYVQPETSYAQRSSDYIRRIVLVAMENVIHLSPRSHGHEIFDDIGICLVENLDPKELEYVIARLERAGLVDYWAIGDQSGNRTLRATDLGLEVADTLVLETRAPGFLLEETIAQLERTVGKQKPLLVEKLRELSVRVAEAKELNEHDVGEIAQSCLQVIQDFLDIDILWEGISEERPEKGKTRDRLRVLLKAKAPSDTEADMLDALQEYVVGWSGRFETFVHKYRHLPGEADRRHAKRCVVYTYLLLADIAELLGM